jgi:DNA-binding MarR family transcriptional regulator
VQRQDILTLQVLEEIENNGAPSQRQIAKQLNISLGLANSFIKRLVHKGYLKITTIPKNRMRYILTPQGAAEKTRLTYEFVRFSFRFYKETRQKLKNIISDLEKEGVRRIAFYGSGELAEIAFISLLESQISLVSVFDDSRSSQKFNDQKVNGLEKSSDFDFDKILITVHENAERIETELIEFGVAPYKIVLIN